MTHQALMEAVKTALKFPVFVELDSGRRLHIPHPDYVISPPEIPPETLPKDKDGNPIPQPPDHVIVYTDGRHFNIVAIDQIASVSSATAPGLYNPTTR